MTKITGIIIFLLLAGLCLPVNNALCQNNNDTLVVDTSSGIEIVAPPVEEFEEEYDEDEEETTESGEAIIAVLKSIPADSLNAIKNDKGFAYMAHLDSLLRAAQNAKNKKPEVKEPVRDNSSSFWDLEVVKYIFWGIAIAVVGFVLFRLFSGEGGMFTTNKTLAMPEVTTDEEIPESDLEGLLQKAIRNGNYRLAVRYQFLKTLNRLGEKGILQLSTDKTNYQYATEIQGKPYANSFARLSLQYEYVWFGEFDLNKEQFEIVQNEHQQFLKQI
jgi:hypothetical protein